MKFTVTSTIPKYDLKGAINKSMTQSVLLIHGKAVKNAPYLTGNLRRSITPDFKLLKKGIGVVGTNVKYARVREYVNRKNPNRKYYMRRALKSSEHKIKQIFIKNLKNVLNNK